MPIIRNAEVEFSPGPVENTRRRMLVNPDIGAGATTLGEIIMEQDTELLMHTHRVEESMVITKGEAIAILGDETHTLKTGDVILVPAGVKHTLANRGSEPMGFLFFYPSVEVRVERV